MLMDMISPCIQLIYISRNQKLIDNFITYLITYFQRDKISLFGINELLESRFVKVNILLFGNIDLSWYLMGQTMKITSFSYLILLS